MLAPSYPYYLANRPVSSDQSLIVCDKYSGEEATSVARADRNAIDLAITRAVEAAPAMAAMPAYQRQAVLEHCVAQFRARESELAEALCIEAGKPIKDAEGEVTRLIDTFKIAAEEATRIGGEVIPMDISPRAVNYRGHYKRVPIGPCSFISPFNFPLNLVAHKVAPAIAAGCPFVLKPASLTPVGALIIGDILAETSLPEGAFSILPCSRDDAELFTTDERLKLLSFTGSPDVGWALKAKAGKKPVILELGGNAACVVNHDADLEDAVERIVFGAFYQSGQSCIGVQRIYAHEAVYDEFKERFIKATKALKAGDPKQRDTFIGPMISSAEAERLEDWINQALDNGARQLAGGPREDNRMPAWVLENVGPDQPLRNEEAFGPAAILDSFSDFDEVLADINRSRFGLQAGIFTRDIYLAQKAFDTLEVGAVIIGDVPSWRIDHMPYGGVKDSGLGREGLRYAIEDMTEIRLMVVRTPPKKTSS